MAGDVRLHLRLLLHGGVDLRVLTLPAAGGRQARRQVVVGREDFDQAGRAGVVLVELRVVGQMGHEAHAVDP